MPEYTAVSDPAEPSSTSLPAPPLRLLLIHDNMIAYVFVTDSPWTGLTGSDGRVAIDDVPPGAYQAQVWHYRYPPRRELPSARVAVSSDTTRWAANIRVMAQSSTRSHAGSY